MTEDVPDDLDEVQLATVLQSAGIVGDSLVSWARLGDANFNLVYRVGLVGGDRLVVKIAPDPTVPTLRYERDIVRTEAMFYRRASSIAPVPNVVHTDFTRQVVERDVLVMTELPGENWYRQRERISAGDRSRLRGDLGGVVAALHTVTGDGFGYPQLGVAASWRDAFMGMTEALLADAGRFSASLPCPLRQIEDALIRNADALDEVLTPVLVHFDLWDGNLLVDSSKLTGIVDGERAFWGDPLADMVSLALFGDIERDEDFLSGYWSAGGQIDFDAHTRHRLAMYRCYLYTIMLVEAVPRGTTGPAHDGRNEAVSRHLVDALAALTP